MNARNETLQLLCRLKSRGINPTFDQANTLRRAQLTLHRWYEQECGDSTDYASVGIERDEETGKPYRVVWPHTSKTANRYPIADREAGAQRRVNKLCASLGLHAYYQTDPRGCALYVSTEPVKDNDYTRGIACC